MSNQIVLHAGQSEVFADLFVRKTVRHAVAVTSRGWGKSFLAAACSVNAVMELLQLNRKVPNKNVYIVAPTYAQVTDIYFPLLAYTMGMERYTIKPPSKDSGKFIFAKGVELHLVSYEAIDRLRGSGAYFIVCDEVRDWTKGGGHKDAWEGVLHPCMVTRWSRKRAEELRAVSPSRSLTISTAKGYNYFYDMYNMEEKDSDYKSYKFDYTTSPYLDAKEIENIRHNCDPIFFAREYLASFEESGNSVFYCFDRKLHVKKDIEPLQEHEDVHIGIDFNVGYICKLTINFVNSGKTFNTKTILIQAINMQTSIYRRSNDYPEMEYT